MSTCPKCDSTLKPGTYFCGKCGNQNETTPMDSPEEMTAELKTREENHGAGAPRQLRTRDLTTRASASRVEPRSKAAGDAPATDETTDTNDPAEAPPEVRAPRRRWHVALLAAVVPAIVVAAAAVYVLGQQSANGQCKEERATIATLTANNERLITAVEEAAENNRKLSANNEKAAAAIEKATAVIEKAVANNEKLNTNNQRLAATVEKVSAAKDKIAEELAATRANVAREFARNGNKGRAITGRTGYSRASSPRDDGDDRRKKSDRQGRPAGRTRRGAYSASNGSGGAGGRYLSRK